MRNEGRGGEEELEIRRGVEALVSPDTNVMLQLVMRIITAIIINESCDNEIDKLSMRLITVV